MHFVIIVIVPFSLFLTREKESVCPGTGEHLYYYHYNDLLFSCHSFATCIILQTNFCQHWRTYRYILAVFYMAIILRTERAANLVKAFVATESYT